MKRATGSGNAVGLAVLISLAACSHEQGLTPTMAPPRSATEAATTESARAEAAKAEAAAAALAAAGPRNTYGAAPAESATPERASPPVPPPADVTDPVAAVERMGSYLGSLEAFVVEGSTSTDEVLESGQKVQFDKTITMWVDRPNRLRAEVKAQGQERSFFYDGNTFTLYSPQLGFYASFDAPTTLRDLIEVASERYDLEFPLVDLFYFGSDESTAGPITSATYVGPGDVLGTVTDHYAFRAQDVDWQVWIQRGDKPLPRKLVVTTKGVRHEPQHSVVLKWNLLPRFSARNFGFVPPEGAQRIVFEKKR